MLAHRRAQCAQAFRPLLPLGVGHVRCAAGQACETKTYQDLFHMKVHLRIIPLTLAQLNAFVQMHHRHHKPVQGHRFSLGVARDGFLVGACSVGRPVARACDPYQVAEVTRLVTDGSRNACSILYAAAARACAAMGFERIQTYILDTEPGTSLRASGWRLDGVTAGGDWNHSKAYAGSRRTDQPQSPKQRWVKILNKSAASLRPNPFD